jgi:hypothetical protein
MEFSERRYDERLRNINAQIAELQQRVRPHWFTAISQWRQQPELQWLFVIDIMQHQRL